MIDINESVVIQIVNFILLIWVLNAVLFKPVRAIMNKRKEKVNGLEKNINDFLLSAKEKQDTFSSGLKAARDKGLKEKEALIQKASAEEEEIIKKINQKAQSDLLKIREKIVQEADDVRNSLRKEIDSFAGLIARKLLGRSV
ncbi:MAG: ATP synthase F0 subunit B [Desulfobacterales bacterium]|nr:ATP synthase F0 subunit B [Desulfobacterales bacterium]